MTEFEFHVPEAITTWRNHQKLELESVGPGVIWGNIVHRTISYCASDECWFVMRIETFGDHVGIDKIHQMRVEGMRSALTGRTMRAARQVYVGPYPPPP